MATSKWLPTTEEQRLVWAIRIAVVLGVLVAIGYAFDKNLWDWLSLLIVPAAIAVGAAWFNQQQRSRELNIAEIRSQEEAFQAYLDRIADLMLHENLMERAKPGLPPDMYERLEVLERRQGLFRERLEELAQQVFGKQLQELEPQEVQESEESMRQPLQELEQLSTQLFAESQRWGMAMREPMMIARAFTLTVLDRLDGNYKGKVANFLHESGMIRRTSKLLSELLESPPGRETTDESAIIPLHNANFSGADLSGAVLADDNLAGANLKGADLSGATLTGTHLTGANLRDANLSTARLGTARVTPVRRNGRAESAPPNPADLRDADLPRGGHCRRTRHGQRLLARACGFVGQARAAPR